MGLRIDEYRAYLVLRENIASLRRDLGEDSAWNAVDLAVKYNLRSLNNTKEANANENHARSIENHG